MKLSLQFHATRDEIATMVRAWGLRHNLVLFWLVEQGSLFSATTVDTLEEPMELPLDVTRIGLSARPLDTACDSFIDFMHANHHVLVIYLGKLADAGLQESFLSAGSDDARIAAIWNSVRRAAVAKMLKGATVVGPTGIRMRDEPHRYTVGAKALADKGVRMLPLAGGSVYILD